MYRQVRERIIEAEVRKLERRQAIERERSAAERANQSHDRTTRSRSAEPRERCPTHP
jgi:hypothetical protein